MRRRRGRAMAPPTTAMGPADAPASSERRATRPTRGRGGREPAGAAAGGPARAPHGGAGRTTASPAVERRAASRRRARPRRARSRGAARRRATTPARRTETAPSRVAAMLRPSGENGDGAVGLGERVGRWLSSVTDRPAPEAAAPPCRRGAPAAPDPLGDPRAPPGGADGRAAAQRAGRLDRPHRRLPGGRADAARVRAPRGCAGLTPRGCRAAARRRGHRRRAT